MASENKGIEVRKAAWQILRRFEKPGTARLKADNLIHEVLQSSGDSWTDQDRGFLTTLVYGVLRQWVLLDGLMADQLSCPIKKVEPKVRTLIRLGLFQLKCLDHIPDYAAIDGVVALAKKTGCSQKTVGFINGVLRGYQRNSASEDTTQPEIKIDSITQLAAQKSLPGWVASLLVNTYGLEASAEMADVINQPATLSLRVNQRRTSVEDYCKALDTAGVTYHQPDPTLPACLHLDEFAGSPRKLPGYEEGWFAVQDLSSAVVSTWMNPQPGETIVDLCAAPGSKTAHLADLMQDTGSIIAVEPEKERIARLTENLMRLGIQCVMVVQGKGETVEVDPAWNAIDEILVDAPCSGLGTVRKHPEILLQLKEADVTGYAKLQLALLRHAVTLIKPGGKLIYSTCSLHPAENQEVVQAFLRDCPSATLVREEQRLITQVQDGFYIAQFEC